jgi:hypothetical protein
MRAQSFRDGDARLGHEIAAHQVFLLILGKAPTRGGG